MVVCVWIFESQPGGSRTMSPDPAISVTRTLAPTRSILTSVLAQENIPLPASACIQIVEPLIPINVNFMRINSLSKAPLT